MQIIQRDICEELTVNIGLFTKDDVKEVVRKKFGDVKIIGVSRNVQVSINSDGRLVIRLYPFVTIQYKDEKGNEVNNYVSLQSPDVLIVLSKDETIKLIDFLRKVDINESLFW